MYGTKSSASVGLNRKEYQNKDIYHMETNKKLLKGFCLPVSSNVIGMEIKKLEICSKKSTKYPYKFKTRNL